MTTPTLAELTAQIAEMQASLDKVFRPSTFRDVHADSERLYIGGKDVTAFRGRLAQIGSYQLQEPFAFGPAEFSLPQVTAFEVDKMGRHGSLSWLRKGARVELVPVTNGDRGRAIWRGFIARRSVSSDEGITLHCDGELSGRLATRILPATVNARQRDLGVVLYDLVLAGARISMTPYLGPKTGIIIDDFRGGGEALSLVNDLLSRALIEGGGQWTIGRGSSSNRFVVHRKDTTTVHATVFLGAPGVSLDVEDDIQEEPTHAWGTGTDPRGQKWVNAFYPNLVRGPAAPYPFHDGRSFGIGTTDAQTDTKGGIFVMHRKLIGHGWMTRAEGHAGSPYDGDTADAVQVVQRLAGLPRTGVMDTATWRALFNVSITGRSIQGAQILPLAVLDGADRFIRTANGSPAAQNPQWDRSIVPVDITVDHGNAWKSEAVKWSRRLLERIQHEKNWVGTLSLNGVDVFEGDVSADTPRGDLVPMSRSRLAAGMNIKVAHFAGTSTLFHISGINVDGDRNARLAIDTRARDLLTVGAIIARHKESRRNPAREFIREHRRGAAFDNMVIWNEVCGVLDMDMKLQGGHWNHVIIPAGQSGTIERVRVHLRDSRAKFVMGISAFSLSEKRMHHIAGDPFEAGPAHLDPQAEAFAPKWAQGWVQHRLKNRHMFLYTVGSREQPCGYYPRIHTGADNKHTNAPITGDWEDDAGFAFRTFAFDQGRQKTQSGVLHLWIYPDRDTHLQSGQILYANQTEGA